MKVMKKLLIASSVCQKPRILESFLSSLKNLELSKWDVTYKFIDDNQLEETSKLLQKSNLNNKTIITKAPPKESLYRVDDITHHWSDSLVLRVAELKNEIIKYAIDNKYEYLFLIDSDLLINPELVNHLYKQNKDIISEIFWTSWQPDAPPLPNVWMYDTYDMALPSLDKKTKQNHSLEFLNKLKNKGVYEVGGLGACTLIKTAALKKGVNFSPIKNISFWGEDRWFCIRAAAMGFSLFVDTHYPATHLYRESDIEKN